MGCADSRNRSVPPPPSFIEGGRATIGGSYAKKSRDNALSEDSDPSLETEPEKREPEYQRRNLSTKPNQDRLISNIKTVLISPALGDSFEREIKLYGVCDGHGRFGAEVAHFVATGLPNIIYDCFSNQYLQGLNSVNAILEESISIIKKRLKAVDVNTKFSGCTVLLCLIFESNLYTCNLGDSRAVIAYQSNQKLVAEAISEDACPSRPSIRTRIQNKGGTVSLDPMGNACLVAETPSGKRKFTLGMGTSMGDTWATNFGLSNRPDITMQPLTSGELFVVLGSDGIWSVLSNEAVISLCYKGLIQKDANVDVVCMQVATMCCELWAERYDRCDDVSMIIAILQEIPKMKRNLKLCAEVEFKNVQKGSLQHGTLRSASPHSILSNTIRWRYVITKDQDSSGFPGQRLYLDMEGENLEEVSWTDSAPEVSLCEDIAISLDRLDSTYSVGAASVSLDYLDVAPGLRSPFSSSTSFLDGPFLVAPGSTSHEKQIGLTAVTPQNSIRDISTPQNSTAHIANFSETFQSEEFDLETPDLHRLPSVIASDVGTPPVTDDCVNSKE